MTETGRYAENINCTERMLKAVDDMNADVVVASCMEIIMATFAMVAEDDRDAALLGLEILKYMVDHIEADIRGRH